MIPASTNQLFSAGTGYQISRSVRLRSSASAYFNRTLTSTNRQRWTWSGWVKRGVLTSFQALFAAPVSAGATEEVLYLASGDQLLHNDGSVGILAQTNAVLRDASAWYHIVYVYDSANATQANRGVWYINGVQQTNSTNAISLNRNSFINHSVSHAIGRLSTLSSGPLDGYLTEINFIDGQALTPSSFGETDAVTGVWKPKRYTGTYGTNGFYLNFSDPSAATAAAIGKDYSGNGNNWTPNNISVTAGVTYDSMLDVPTPWGDGGNGRGNYCVLNRLVASGLSGGGTISNGNLRVSGAAAVSNAYARGTMTLSGKFYAEFSFDVVNATATIGVDAVTATSGALNTSSTSVSYRSGGNRRVLGTETAYGASWVANDIIGVAVDTAANTVEFFKNGTSQGVITSSAFFAQGDCVFAMSKDDVGSPNGFANFGQRPFAYTPPTGFNALNTQNLPTPTILKGNQYFDINLWTGTGASRSITNSGAMQPDLVWTKDRGVGTSSHGLFDSVRGNTKVLSSNSTSAEITVTDEVTSFNADGFSLGASAAGYANFNGRTFVGWQWKEGATQGFDIVTYTGNGANRTIAHSLGVAPRMMIVKGRNFASSGWIVWHSALLGTEYLSLEATNAKATAATVWNSTVPDSSVFSLGTNTQVNQNTSTFVAYLFAQVAGFSRFGSYTGNGSTDGPFVFCGFRPKWVMMKRTDTGGFSWIIQDTARDVDNPNDLPLYPDLSNAEAASNFIDILSNGFKLRNLSGGWNASGGTYIFAAFAEHPFKNALAR